MQEKTLLRVLGKLHGWMPPSETAYCVQGWKLDWGSVRWNPSAVWTLDLQIVYQRAATPIYDYAVAKTAVTLLTSALSVIFVLPFLLLLFLLLLFLFLFL